MDKEYLDRAHYAASPIRYLALHDVPELLMLCAEHAAFQNAEYTFDGKQTKLERVLETGSPELIGWVAQLKGTLVASLTATMDFSTWTAEAFMHLDCLYVRAPYRGEGIGRELIAIAIEEAGRRGIPELQQHARMKVAGPPQRQSESR